MNALKLAAFAIITAFAGAMAFAGQSGGLSREQVQGSVSFQAVDNFLADSKKYLGL